MKVAISAATSMEWQLLHDTIDRNVLFEKNGVEILYITTGIGVMATTFSLSKLIYAEKPALIIQVGIAGSFTNELQLNEVVAVNNDCQGDLVVEEDGQLLDLFDLKLNDENMFPFCKKKLPNAWIDNLKIDCKKVNAVTVSEITTNSKRINQLQQKYNAAIETMEGAALHYVCLQNDVPFLQIKAISNYVGERNKSKWSIKNALANLSSVVSHFLLELKHEHLNKQEAQ